MRKIAQLGQLHHLAVVGIIIAITTLVVVLPIMKQGGDAATDAVDRSRCATTVRQHAASQAMVLSEFRTRIDCPTQEIELKQHNDDDQTKNEAFLKIGDGLLSCWDDFGRGKLDLFKGEGVYCNICNFAQFKQGSKPKTYTGLNEFLAKRKVPGTSTSYLTQLTGLESKGFAEVFDNPEDLKVPESAVVNAIQSSKVYSTIFVYAKGEEGLQQVKDYVGGNFKVLQYGVGASIAGGVATGAILFYSGPVGWITAGVVGVIVAATGSGATLAAVLDNDPPQYLAFMSFQQHDPENLKKLNCQDIRYQRSSRSE